MRLSAVTLCIVGVAARGRRRRIPYEKKVHVQPPPLPHDDGTPWGCGPMPSNSTSYYLRDLLQNWIAKQQFQRRHTVYQGGGRSVVVMAKRHGLGNRLNNVIGGFMLALATGRALVINWPPSACRNKRNCDPTSIDDLFDPPVGVKWGRMQGWNKDLDAMCANGPFVISQNGHDAVQQVLDMDLGNYHEQPKMVCAVCDRSWSYGVSCNPLLRCAMPTPWYVYGLLQRWLLRPKRAVVNRVRQTLANHTCAVGVHLRKADNSKTKWATEELLRETYASALKRRPEFKNGDLRYGIYVAADGESTQTKKRIEAFARSVGAPLLERAARFKASRDSVRAMQDALAENYVLSSCVEILPRGSGASTFHDLAVARAAFEQGWEQTRVDAFVHKSEPSDHALVPARCPPRTGETADAVTRCPCLSNETSYRDRVAPWPGPDLVWAHPWRDPYENSTRSARMRLVKERIRARREARDAARMSSIAGAGVAGTHGTF
ncbi:unnamed protein product [Pelagomonas calceolata]|uniref:Uncharacterized protein n=1 Tax=Pelagomonas calceolata TaxID=35677 RepID=A0A8J2SFY6_9STRA|nr:unnamed protein product [Pelagomonas calceolata]